MKRVLLLWIVMMSVVGWPAAAQDDCEIDLLPVIAALTEAQSLANADDPAAALAGIANVQAQLAAVQERCGVVLSQTLEFPDGLFRINYPADWMRGSPSTGVYLLGNDLEAAQPLFGSMTEPLPGGVRALVVGYGDIPTAFNADDFDGLRDQLAEDGLGSLGGFGPPEAITIQDFPGLRLNVISEFAEGAAVLIDLGDNQAAAFVLLVSPGEFDAFAPTFDAILASIQTGPRQASAAPPSAPLLVSEGTPLSELTYSDPPVALIDRPEGMSMRHAVLSPDGRRLAWASQDRELCQQDIALELTRCLPLPERFEGQPLLLMWSPNGRHIAFSPDFIRLLIEPDVWLLDSERETFINLTDDGIDQSPQRAPSGDGPRGPVWLDFTYGWGPDNALYLVRYTQSEIGTTDGLMMGLYRVSPETGAADLLRDLTGDFERFSIAQLNQYALKGAVSVSPDASQVAVIVASPRRGPGDGVWLIPFDSSEPLRQLVRQQGLTEGLPVGYRSESLQIIGTAWAPDQRTLYMYSIDPGMVNPDALRMLYAFNLETGLATALTDFSAFEADALREPDASGRSPSYFIPRAVALSPDGTTPIMLHGDPETTDYALTALAVTPTGVQRTTLLDFQARLLFANADTVGADGALLLSGLLFLPEG